jgi:hypothetical protein
MQRLMLASLLSLSLGGCAALLGDDDSSMEVGNAEARISSVPANIACISITAVGNRTVTNNFAVTAGQSAVLRLSNLPVGNDTFFAYAYPAACANIMNAQPSWTATPVIATINSGGVTNLQMTLQPSGGASVGINFDTDGGVPSGDGGTSISDGGSPTDMPRSTD